MHKGKQRTRPNEQTDPQPAEERLILPEHLDHQPNSKSDNGNEKSKHNRGHQQESFRQQRSRHREDGAEERAHAAKEGGARVDRDVGVETTGGASSTCSPSNHSEANEDPATEGTTAQGREAGKRGTACRPETSEEDCAVATAGPSNVADGEWTTATPERNNRAASSNPRRCSRLGLRCCLQGPKCPIGPRLPQPPPYVAWVTAKTLRLPAPSCNDHSRSASVSSSQYERLSPLPTQENVDAPAEGVQ